MTNEQWPFADPPNVAVFTTRSIINGAESILRVSHDEDDGAWQFHSGRDITDDVEGIVVALSRIISLDPSIVELHNLPTGWIAWRTDLHSKWFRFKSDDHHSRE